jgi:hypothetical protein
MKKSVLSIVILAISIPLQAQASEKEPETKTKTCYSIAWGLFKSKDCPDVKSVDVVIHKPEIATSASESTVENSDVETKRILWGAIQWTVKKKKDE